MGGIAAVQSVPQELITVSRVYGATRLQIIREIYLPAMAPILLESVRLGMVFNITAVLLCEIDGARDGIGYRIAAWGENVQIAALRRARHRDGGRGGGERGAARGREPAVGLARALVTRALVAVRRVSQRFGVDRAAVLALESIDLEIPDGQFVALVGPSGCGKSTLLSLVAGLRLPSDGTVLCDGEPITGPMPRKIGGSSGGESPCPGSPRSTTWRSAEATARRSRATRCGPGMLDLTGLTGFGTACRTSSPAA